MIRWARRADEEFGTGTGTLEDWQAAWLRRWRHPPAGRDVFVLAAAAPAEVEEHLAELSVLESPRPGTRLVVTLVYQIEQDQPWTGGLLSVFDCAGWAPELPHRCDPLPGDPRTSAAWREKERVFVDRLGSTRIGFVLAKKLQPAEMESTTFVASPGEPEAGGYFPLPADGHIPLPERVLRGGPFRAGDLAEAFGVSLRDAMPLIDELLACGAIAII